jgi:hypothetical protein
VSGGESHVEVHGSVGGNIVAGNWQLIVNGALGSSVASLPDGGRPEPSPRTPMRSLPGRPSGFAGRTAELSAIAAAVAARSPIQLYGPSGAGKSALLREAAHRIDGDVVFVTASGRDAGDVLQEVFESCYQTSGYRPDAAELRRLMSGVGACVIVDDLDATGDSLATILDTVPHAALVFSAPDRELWGQGRTIGLSGLREDEALTLFRRAFGREMTSAEVAAASRSWREFDGLPIAMRRSAAILAGTQAPAHRAIPHQRDPDDPDRTLALPVPLTAPQRDMYDLLRALPYGPLPLTAMARLASAPGVGTVSEEIERLIEVGLAQPSVPGAVQLPPDLLAAPIPYRRDVAALTESMIDWLADGDTSLGEVAEGGPLIIALVDACMADGQPRLGCRLARAAAPPLASSLRWGLWRDLLISGQAAATAGDDMEALAYFTHERGIRMLCLGQASAAAGLLVGASGMWRALGLPQPASLAEQALAMAAAPPPPCAPSAPLAPGFLPAPQPPRPVRRFIGRATTVRRSTPDPSPGYRAWILWVLIAVLIVMGLMCAALVIGINRTTRPAGKGSAPAIPIVLPSRPAASPSPPSATAYSEFARDWRRSEAGARIEEAHIIS